MSKTVLLHTIQFSMSMQFSSIWPIDWTLSGATTPGQSGPVSNGNEGVLHIPQSSSSTGTSSSDCLVSYLRHSFGGVPLSGDAVGVFYHPSQLGRKGYWMRNNQNRGCKKNGNLLNINKIQYLPVFVICSPTGQVWHSAFF